MADVEEVEATVGEDDGFAGGAPLGDALLDAVAVEDLFGGGDAGAGGELGDELMRSDGDGTGLADDDAGGEVGELDRSAHGETGGDAGSERGDDGVAGARDVEDLASACGKAVDAAQRVSEGGPEDSDSLLAHGDGEELEVVLGRKLLAGGEEFGGVVDGDARGFGELVEVGADGGGAPVPAEVGGLGISEHGDGVFVCEIDDRPAERGGEDALGVVGEDDGVDLGDEATDPFAKPLRVFGRGHIAALDVEPQQLLIAADDACLRDGRRGGRDDADGVDTGTIEDGGELCLLGIGAPKAGEIGMAAEAGEVHGDVGCAARSLVPLGMAEDGDGGLGRDAVDFTGDVAIEHEVADDKHTELSKAAFKKVQSCVEIRKHRSWSGSLLSIIALRGRARG